LEETLNDRYKHSAEYWVPKYPTEGEQKILNPNPEVAVKDPK
jgi:hypothetical protein